MLPPLLLLLVLLLLQTEAGSGGGQTIRVSVRSSVGKEKLSNPLKHVSFCGACPSPDLEGSHTWGLAPKHGQFGTLGVERFSVLGDLVYAVPNDASDALLNVEDVPGQVLLVERGAVPMVEKVLRAQEAGAKAVLIADDGKCSDDFQRCGRTGGIPEGGFAWKDGSHVWASVTIPALMISRAQADRLKGMMQLRAVTIAGIGEQLVQR